MMIPRVWLIIALFAATISVMAEDRLPPPSLTTPRTIAPKPIDQQLAIPSPGLTFKNPVLDFSQAQLPESLTGYGEIPPSLKNIPKRLTLRTAILLALRNNPTVVNSELDRINQKYLILLAWQEFRPNYVFNNTAMWSNKRNPTFNVNFGTSIKSPWGTVYSMNYNNSLVRSLGGNIDFSITQPLARGFGRVNTVRLFDAYDQEDINRLIFKEGIITVIVQVVTNYRNLVQSYNNLAIQKRNLDLTVRTVREFRLRMQAGKAAPSDLIQQQANLESSRLTYLENLNTLQNNYQTFLASLGLIPNANLQIDDKIDVKNVTIPSPELAVRIALAHNTNYQAAIIGLRVTQRGILTAQDARRPQVDVVLRQQINQVLGNPTFPVGGRSLNLTVNVPIDDIAAKAILVGAEIAYKQQKLLLQQTKEDLIRNVLNQIREIKNLNKQIEIGQENVQLREKTLRDSYIKYQYGKITTFELIQQQNDLLSARVSLVSDEIAYLNGVTNLNQTLGITLQKWDIQLSY